MRQRRLLAFIASLLVTAAALMVAPAPARAAITTWISVPTPSGMIGPKVIDVAGWSMDNRAKVQLKSLSTTGNVRNQRWVITEEVPGANIWSFRNVLSGKCLDKSRDAPNGNGNVVYQYTCNTGSANQLWKWLSVVPGNKWGMLQSLSGGRCLDVRGKSFTDGAPLQVWDCVGDWNQRFNIS
uniref:RICIN domain-containing protein n=1 Tax=Paractinoplanes polyasparticus TaxID=2856853 RepID=UPI001C85F00B|nr:RICIN domain-containing protein [Actinoplanes polyasparticus]